MQQVDPKVHLGCPHRGLESDKEIRVAFPAQLTTCFKANPPAIIQLEHQEAFCLADAHVDCPVYKQLIPSPLPESIKAEEDDAAFPIWVLIILACAVLVAIILGILLFGG